MLCLESHDTCSWGASHSPLAHICKVPELTTPHKGHLVSDRPHIYVNTQQKVTADERLHSGAQVHVAQHSAGLIQCIGAYDRGARSLMSGSIRGAHRQLGQVVFFASHPARHSPQNVWPAQAGRRSGRLTSALFYTHIKSICAHKQSSGPQGSFQHREPLVQRHGLVNGVLCCPNTLAT